VTLLFNTVTLLLPHNSINAALWSAGPLHFNIVKVDLSAASVRPIPLVANAFVK
jgi:hypothetical protein